MKKQRPARRRAWIARETARLLSARKCGKTYEQCAKLLGRTRLMVGSKLSRLGATQPNSMRGKPSFEIRWCPRHKRTVQKHYRHRRAEEIASRLCRTRYAIYHRAARLGITSPRPAFWTYADLVIVLSSRLGPRDLRLASRRAVHAIRSKK